MSFSAEMVRARTIQTLESDARNAGLLAIRTVLTEENTDDLIDMVMDKVHLPAWLKWLPIRALLDKLLPGVILGVFEDVLG